MLFDVGEPGVDIYILGVLDREMFRTHLPSKEQLHSTPHSFKHMSCEGFSLLWYRDHMNITVPLVSAG